MKNIFARLSAIFLSIFFFGAFSSVTAAPAPTPGEALYTQYCSVCHGELGAGTKNGPPLVHRIYHPNHHGDMAFYFAVERGVVAHHWRFGDMPKTKGIKKEETAEIIRYIRGLQKEEGIF